MMQVPVVDAAFEHPKFHPAKPRKPRGLSQSREQSGPTDPGPFNQRYALLPDKTLER